MLLGWFGLSTDAPAGEADRLLARLADDLADQGIAVAGAVQVNIETAPDCACDMDIRVIGETGRIRISQDLGAGSAGCRLDTGALEEAALRVARRMAGARLLVVPKFGRQEAFGRGFRGVISDAVLGGIPVILHVPAEQRAAFAEFSGGMAQQVAPEALAEWCRQAAGGQ